MADTQVRRATAVLALLTLCGLLAGCLNGGPTRPSVSEQYDQMKRRPDIDQTVADYERMSTQIRERITTEFALTWAQGTAGGGGAACNSDVPDLSDQGASRTLNDWRTPTTVPDADWNRLVTTVSTIVTNYGFESQPQVLHDKPGDHEVVFHHTDNLPDEAQVHFGVLNGNTSILIFTGCHLTAEAHKRGTPTPKPTY